MSAIFKREFKSYFYSPLGYVFLAFMFFFEAMFFVQTLMAQMSYMAYVFGSMTNFVITFIPLLTMRLMSEDKKLKTDQLLMTAPVSISGVVLGKYFAAVVMFVVSIAPMLVFSVIAAGFAQQDWNVILGNFIALALMGAALIAIGLLISSLTESQMVAGIATFAIMMFILLFDTIASAMPLNFSWIAAIFTGLSFMTRYDDFVEGILNVSHILFFVSVAAGFLFLTNRVLEKKRWS